MSGGRRFAPVGAFYLKPKTIAQLVHRVLDLFGIHSPTLARWRGMGKPVTRDDE